MRGYVVLVPSWLGLEVKGSAIVAYAVICRARTMVKHNKVITNGYFKD